MNELKVNGTQKFMGFDIPVIEGGFGENCKTLLRTCWLLVREVLEFILNFYKICRGFVSVLSKMHKGYTDGSQR